MMGTTVTPADSSGLFALLAAVSDPAATKARLADIVAASAEQQKRLDDTAQAARDAADRNKAADETLAAATAKFDAAKLVQSQFEMSSKRQVEQLAAREALVGNREAAADAREKEFIARNTELKVRADKADADAAELAETVAKQLAEAKAASDDNEKRKAYLDGMIADYEAKLAKLKVLVS